MWKRYLVEFGTGVDLHGMDVMEAARRAVRDAVSQCCMCGLVDLLGISDLEKALGRKAFKEIVSPYVFKPEGKPELAPLSDKREPISNAAEDFSSDE